MSKDSFQSHELFKESKKPANNSNQKLGLGVHKGFAFQKMNHSSKFVKIPFNIVWYNNMIRVKTILE